jgi:chromosome segregation ATPase
MYCNRWIVPGTFLAGLALATAACAPEQSHRDRKRETDRTVLLLSQVERERDALRAEVDALKARPQPTTDQAALAKEAADLRNEVRRLEGELKRSQEQTLNVTEVNTTLKNDLNRARERINTIERELNDLRAANKVLLDRLAGAQPATAPSPDPINK